MFGQILVEVKSPAIVKKDWEMEGRRGVTITQTGYASLDGPYPQEYDIRLQPNQPAYTPGFYVIPRAAYSLRNGKLQIDTGQLAPIAEIPADHVKDLLEKINQAPAKKSAQ